MRVIGFRAESDAVHWACLTGTVENPVIEARDKIRLPKIDFNEGLQDIYLRIGTLVKQQNADRVAVRFTETQLSNKPSKKTLNGMLNRARIEGAIIVAAQVESISVVSGSLDTIRQGLKSKSAKAYLDQDDFRGIDWADIKNKCMREAILTAASALGG